MDRITIKQLSYIRSAISFLWGFLLYFDGMKLIDVITEMRNPGNETLSDDVVKPLPLCMSQNQVLSWMATGLIISMHINAGLVWAVTKHCKWVMKAWLVHAAVWCVICVYIGVLNAFGQAEPDYEKVVVVVIGYIFYGVFIVLVGIFHEVGHWLYVPLNTNAVEHREYLIPNEVLSSNEPIQAVNQLVGDSPSGN